MRPQFGELIPLNYHVVDATRIVATFDVTGAPHGLYDVVVTNPDGQQAVEPYRFLIEDALPLDVTIGMGGKSQLDIGETGIYGVTIQSLTNRDVPYVHYQIGVPRVPNPTSLIPGEVSCSAPMSKASRTSMMCRGWIWIRS